MWFSEGSAASSAYWSDKSGQIWRCFTSWRMKPSFYPPPTMFLSSNGVTVGLRPLKPRRRVPAGKLEEPINLTFMCSDCGRNLECPGKTHADTATSEEEGNQTSGLGEAPPLQRRAALHRDKSRCMKRTQTSEHPMLLQQPNGSSFELKAVWFGTPYSNPRFIWLSGT